MNGLEDLIQEMNERMGRIEGNLTLLLERGQVREAYTPKDLARALGKKEYTVREWCRHGRIRARKLAGGRGNEGEWRIPHEEMIRYQREGLLPLPSVN